MTGAFGGLRLPLPLARKRPPTRPPPQAGEGFVGGNRHRFQSMIVGMNPVGLGGRGDDGGRGVRGDEGTVGIEAAQAPRKRGATAKLAGRPAPYRGMK